MDTWTKDDLNALIQENVMKARYRDADNFEWRPVLVVIDSGGHRTQEIYGMAAMNP